MKGEEHVSMSVGFLSYNDAFTLHYSFSDKVFYSGNIIVNSYETHI